MTKTKKLNKIIPAVLLSGAMVISTSHLISPTIANALESNNSINANTDEACALKFKFYSNGDDGQPLYVSEKATSTKKSAKGMYTNEINIVPSDKETTDDIIIKDSDKVNNLKINIRESINTAKYLAKSHTRLKVQFYLNDDHDNPIYVLQKENGHVKHINNLIIDGNTEQDVFIEGLNHFSNLEIKVSKI